MIGAAVQRPAERCVPQGEPSSVVARVPPIALPSLESIQRAFAATEPSPHSGLVQVESVAQLLLAFVIGNEMAMSADFRVNEKDAAKLLGYTPGSLKNLRQQGQAPASYQRGVGGGRISYRLHDIAAWIELKREAS